MATPLFKVFKKAPVGAGPYKFVSFTPGVELVWRPTTNTA